MLKKFLIFFLMMSVVLLILELILSLFFPLNLVGGYIGAYEYNKQLGVKLKPSIHFLHTTDFQQEVYTNKDGLVNYQSDFSKYKSLAYAVGDSFTQGTGLPSDASYPLQLDLMLNIGEDNKYKNNIAVVNLGLGAYGGEQSLIVLNENIDKRKSPAYILYLGYSNDHVDDQLFLSGYRHKHLVDGSPYWGVFLQPLQWVSNSLEIGKRLKVIVGSFRRKRQVNLPSTSEASEKENVAKLQISVFKRLKEIAKKNNSILIVGWAENPSDNSMSYEWLRRWSENNNVEFADWYTSVKSVQNNIPNLPVYNEHSGGHYRTWVNTIIARTYADIIKKNELKKY